MVRGKEKKGKKLEQPEEKTYQSLVWWMFVEFSTRYSNTEVCMNTWKISANINFANQCQVYCVHDLGPIALPKLKTFHGFFSQFFFFFSKIISNKKLFMHLVKSVSTFQWTFFVRSTKLLWIWCDLLLLLKYIHFEVRTTGPCCYWCWQTV